MRWEGQRESDNVEDRRGMGPARIGGGGLGLGGLVLVLVVSYFTGINPLTLIDMLNGVQDMTESSGPSEPAPIGTPNDQLGKFAAIVLADTETTWRHLLGPQYEDTPDSSFSPEVSIQPAAAPHRPSAPSIAPTTARSISTCHFSTPWRDGLARPATLRKRT
jgi:Predicted metalloprotease